MKPLVVALWENVNFYGRKRLFIESTQNLMQYAFDNTASAIGIHPGPDYEAWKNAHGGKEPVVVFYEHINFGGASLKLEAGEYANIHARYNFGDIISSFRINPPSVLPVTIAPIPVYVILFEHDAWRGNRLMIVENSANIPYEFGSEFNDVTTSIEVFKGPNYTQGDKAQFFRDANYLGGKIDLEPGFYANISKAPYGFNDVISSVKIRA